jgi:uncharacterized protein DUF6636
MKLSTALFAALFVAASPALAETEYRPIGFQTPSGNIHCLYEQLNSDEWLRCDMKQVQKRIPPVPRSCEDDWGQAFWVNKRRAERLCHTDTVISDEWPTLACGATWRSGRFTSISTPIGLTCSNAAGHGFQLSRTSQRFF